MRRSGPLKPNALLGVDYQDFLQGVFYNRVILSRLAFFYLIRCGMVRSRAALCSGAALAMLIFFSFVSFYNWPFNVSAALLIGVFVALNALFFFLHKAAWTELAGAGSFPEDKRAKVYARLVADNYLHAEEWRAPSGPEKS